MGGVTHIWALVKILVNSSVVLKRKNQLLLSIEHNNNIGDRASLPTNPKLHSPNHLNCNVMEAKITLTITEGSLKGKEFTFLDRTTTIIGRAKDCYPQLPDNEDHRTISRYHCLFDINPPAIRVRDLGSKNGTYVNGTKIGQRQAHETPEEGAQQKFPEYDLQSGDKIKLGKTIVQVNVEIIVEEDQTLNLAGPMFPPPNISVQKPNILELIKHLIKQANAGQKNLIGIRGYTITKLLGKGGFGEVYLARNDRTKEQVALKVMLPEMAANQKAIANFQREIENTKALQHLNIVKLLDSGYWYGMFFFTLEYCTEGTVADLMEKRGGKLSVDEAIPIILQVLDGLDYAHNAEIPYIKMANGSIGKGRGLVHRDLKPTNIFISNIGHKTIAKIGDYGLAKAFDLAGLSGQTMSGSMAGTPAFMPRQQVLNFKYVQPEVDVWATAASLYFMLTGYLPREFKSGDDPFLVVLRDNPTPIRKRDANIPKKLAELIDAALIDNPEINFKNAKDFILALLKVI